MKRTWKKSVEWAFCFLCQFSPICITVDAKLQIWVFTVFADLLNQATTQLKKSMLTKLANEVLWIIITGQSHFLKIYIGMSFFYVQATVILWFSNNIYSPLLYIWKSEICEYKLRFFIRLFSPSQHKTIFWRVFISMFFFFSVLGNMLFFWIKVYLLDLSDNEGNILRSLIIQLSVFWKRLSLVWLFNKNTEHRDDPSSWKSIHLLVLRMIPSQWKDRKELWKRAWQEYLVRRPEWNLIVFCRNLHKFILNSMSSWSLLRTSILLPWE